MASEYKLLTQSPDDVSLQDLSVEDEHFDIANTKEIRRNNVHNATKNLLEHESGDVKKLLVYSLETASFVDISEEENSSHKQNENHKASRKFENYQVSHKWNIFIPISLFIYLLFIIIINIIIYFS